MLNATAGVVVDWTINAGNVGSAFVIVTGLLVQAIKLQALVKRHDELLGEHAKVLDAHQVAVERVAPIEEGLTRHERAIGEHAAQIGRLEVGHARIASYCEATHGDGRAARM